MNGQPTEGNAAGSPNPAGPTIAQLHTQIVTLTHLVETVATLVRSRPSESDQSKDFSIKTAATLLGKAEYTVREWASEGRINAFRSKGHMSGKHPRWRVHAEEIARYKAEGLLPPDPGRNRDRYGKA